MDLVPKWNLIASVFDEFAHVVETKQSNTKVNPGGYCIGLH